MNGEIDYQSLIKNAQESMNAQIHAKHRSEEAYSQENLSNWLKDYSNTPIMCNQDEKPRPERERDIFDDFVDVVDWFLGRR
jgi:hypothetical protein